MPMFETIIANILVRDNSGSAKIALLLVYPNRRNKKLKHITIANARVYYKNALFESTAPVPK